MKLLEWIKGLFPCDHERRVVITWENNSLDIEVERLRYLDVSFWKDAERKIARTYCRKCGKEF